MSDRIAAKIGPGEGPRQLIHGFEDPHIEITGRTDHEVRVQLFGVEPGKVEEVAFVDNGFFRIPRATYAKVIAGGTGRSLICCFHSQGR